MRLAIGSDHAGFALKEKVKEALIAAGHVVHDFGCYSLAPADYPDYGYAVAQSVAGGEWEKGIVICATGIGMSISANKVKGIRAALCHDLLTAQLSRQHNDANVLAMGGRCVTTEVAIEIAERWLATEFEGGRHQRRVDKIMAGEGC
jgi:ribose 5-phosphate isomerase B